jgi:subfamily B ATP-binding cassette protein HlyB/CyaB
MDIEGIESSAWDAKAPPDRAEELGGNLVMDGIVILAQFHGIAVDAERLRHEFALGEGGPDEVQLLQMAKRLGLKAQILTKSAQSLNRVALPAMALRNDGEAFIVAKIEAGKVLVHDLRLRRALVLSDVQLSERYEGRILVAVSRASLRRELARFDFSWFIPAVVKYRKALLETLAVSVVLQILALVTPLFFQVVMDKVLVHRAMATLNVITFALVVVTVFSILLSSLRSFIFSHTTSRIDVELGAQLFRHVMALPIAWFDARRVGDTTARIRELDNIRNFLTGQALTSVLDLLFTVIFLAVMSIYSGWLTLMVAVSLPLYGIWSASIGPLLRARLNEKFARGADNQAFLIESVSGISTVKALAIEPRVTRAWDNQLAASVSSGFQVARLANVGQQGVQLLQRSVSVAILYFGARLVVSGDMTVGQLVAFNMLAGQVAAPIVRLAQLWQDFQQVGISVARLGDVLNSKPELVRSNTAMPTISGRIRLEGVSFRYRPEAPLVVNDASLDVTAGEVIGIVGRSGSGKSSLTRLIQRLYVPEAGRIMIDGFDLSMADTAWLRRQLGVVLQENFLFNRTIRENIAVTDPGAPMDQVVYAAKLAGAHDFIAEFPEGYDTMVSEQGASLSGGQRQRLAIARALITNPRILIFDEATSALDYESERIVMENMRAICRGRTVLIIAHRLSTVRHADRIVVMDRGRIVECGAPADLLANVDGAFSQLHRLQQG